jgi:hypothetical protein
VTPEQQQEARVAYLTARACVLALEATLIEIASLLDRNDIQFLVLKGPAVGRLAYPDPGVRFFGDLDLLVPPKQFDRAVQLLTDLGWYRPFTEHRPGFIRRFGKGTNFVTPSGSPIDLHCTLIEGPIGQRIDANQLLATCSTITLGRRRLPALGTEERLLHACVEAAAADKRPRIVTLRDVAQMALAPSLDLKRMQRLAGRWTAGLVVAEALRLAWSVFDLTEMTPILAWAWRYQPTAEETLTLDLYRRRATDNDHVGFAVGTWRSVPGVGDKVSYLRALLLSDRDYMNARGYPSHVQRWREGTRVGLAWAAGRGRSLVRRDRGARRR